MAEIHYASTASFCVENARELGIPAALLLDKIVRLSKSTERKDGFCWYTSKQFEEETSLKKDAFANAAKKLEDAGVVERKVTYIIGTMKKATHFRLLEKSEVRSEPPSTSAVRPAFSEYNKNTINTHHFGGSEMRVVASPFDASTKQIVSVRPSLEQKNDQAAIKRRRSFAILKELYDEFGWRGKPNENEAALLTSALDNGYDKESIKSALSWLEAHEFWGSKPVVSKLSDTALKQYDAFSHSQKVDNGMVQTTETDPDRQNSERYKAWRKHLQDFNMEQLRDVL